MQANRQERTKLMNRMEGQICVFVEVNVLQQEVTSREKS